MESQALAQVGEIQAAVNRTRTAVREAHDMVNKLEERLNPVLSTPLKEAGALVNEANSAPVDSVLGSDVHTIAGDVESLVVRLVHLVERVRV